MVKKLKEINHFCSLNLIFELQHHGIFKLAYGTLKGENR